MADGSVAPKERINIAYKSAAGGASEETELPLKLMVVGDYTGKENDDVLEDREPVNIHKDNFGDVMKSHKLSVDLSVPNKLEDGATDDIAVSLNFNSMKDFAPDSIATQIPELNSLLELRKALLALKGPLGNVPAFRKTIQKILDNDDTRKQIMDELGVEG